jgi:hypothetical protein
VRYPILIGQAIGQQIANAPRPQDRNTVAALASKIDPMLAQIRSFVTMTSVSVWDPARGPQLWNPVGHPLPLGGRRPPFPMEAVRPACSDHQHLSEGSSLRKGIGGQQPDQQRPDPVGAGRPKSSRSGARNAMQSSGKTEPPSLARIAGILAKSMACQGQIVGHERYHTQRF